MTIALVPRRASHPGTKSDEAPRAESRPPGKALRRARSPSYSPEERRGPGGMASGSNAVGLGPRRARITAGPAGALLSVAAALILGADPPSLHAQGDEGLQGVQLVDSVEVVGNVREAKEFILQVARIRPGTRISYTDLQRAIKDLWATHHFRDIAVRVRGGGRSGDPVIVTFEVQEQPLVRTIDIRGLRNMRAGRVRDSTGLEDNQPYSPEKVAAAKQFIRDGLSRMGIPFVQIEERKESIPDRDNEIRLIFDVTEGTRVTIVDLEFQGNQAISEDELRDAMEVKEEGFWWFRSGTYDRETFRDDLLDRIPTLYESKGFLQFRLASDTLIVDQETGKARLRLVVEEGPQFHLSEFTIEGNSKFSDEELREYYQPEEGGLLRGLGFGGGSRGGTEVFNRGAFEEGASQIQQLYRNSGHLYVQVTPVWEPVTEQGGEPSVAARWIVREGPLAHVNKILIVGNDFTHDYVIREKIYLLPGDEYSEEALARSYQAVSSLGFFKSPLDVPAMSEHQSGEVDITFRVEENQTGTFNFGTAMGGGTGLAGFIGYDQSNLFGQAKVGNVRWDFGRYINSFTLTYSDPSLFQSFVSGKFSVFNSRDRFFQFQTGDRKRRGLSTTFGVPLPGATWTRVFAGYSISRTRYRLRRGTEDTSLFGRPPGTQSTFSIGITRRTLNHPVFPTAGSLQSINSEFSGGILQGDAHFSKITYEGTWWAPAGQFGDEASPSRLAFGLSVKGGTIVGDADDFPFERFWMGGVQFGERLRGYDETSITPLGYFPERGGGIADIDRLGNAYLLLSAEYALRLSDNLSFSLFYDAGNTWSHAAEIDPTRLFRGAGIGLLIVTPFGPIGLDYAYGFDKPVPGWQLHFRLGGGGL